MKNSDSVKMHSGFFDKSKQAIIDGYYLEAVMYEYASIEGRLEVICGLLGLPCNKDLDKKIRRKIKIDNRRKCLATIYKKHPACKDYKTKLDEEFWGRLKTWIDERNTYVHGLYKSPSEYISRINRMEGFAIEGREFARLLYNEAARLRRIAKNHPEKMSLDEYKCESKKCY